MRSGGEETSGQETGELLCVCIVVLGLRVQCIVLRLCLQCVSVVVCVQCMVLGLCL